MRLSAVRLVQFLERQTCNMKGAELNHAARSTFSDVSIVLWEVSVLFVNS